MKTIEFTQKIVKLFNEMQQFQAFSFATSSPFTIGEPLSIAFLNVRCLGTCSSISKIVYICKLVDRHNNVIVLQEFDCFDDFYSYIIEHKLPLSMRPQQYRYLISRFF